MRATSWLKELIGDVEAQEPFEHGGEEVRAGAHEVLGSNSSADPQPAAERAADVPDRRDRLADADQPAICWRVTDESAKS